MKSLADKLFSTFGVAIGAMIAVVGTLFPVAMFWAMFTDFQRNNFFMFSIDFLLAPVGAIRGFGFWFGWW